MQLQNLRMWRLQLKCEPYFFFHGPLSKIEFRTIYYEIWSWSFNTASFHLAGQYDALNKKMLRPGNLFFFSYTFSLNLKNYNTVKIFFVRWRQLHETNPLYFKSIRVIKQPHSGKKIQLFHLKRNSQFDSFWSFVAFC